MIPDSLTRILTEPRISEADDEARCERAVAFSKASEPIAARAMIATMDEYHQAHGGKRPQMLATACGMNNNLGAEVSAFIREAATTPTTPMPARAALLMALATGFKGNIPRNGPQSEAAILYDAIARGLSLPKIPAVDLPEARTTEPRVSPRAMLIAAALIATCALVLTALATALVPASGGAQ